jgi:hypothetical protein
LALETAVVLTSCVTEVGTEVAPPLRRPVGADGADVGRAVGADVGRAAGVVVGVGSAVTTLGAPPWRRRLQRRCPPSSGAPCI